MITWLLTPSQVGFGGARWLSQGDALQADWVWQSELGVQLLSTSAGAGRLTVMADFQPFFNADIGLFDNALALKRLVEAGASEEQQVWFLERELPFPSLTVFLRTRAPAFTLCFVLAMFFSVWVVFARRREPTQVASYSDSQLREQLYARAHFRWRIGDRQCMSDLLDKTPHALQQAAAVESSHKTSQGPLRYKTFLVRAAQAHWLRAQTDSGESHDGSTTALKRADAAEHST